jgi:hypothetical protein
MSEINNVKSWVVTVVTEGLGAAFGVAIVAFVGYTALGVYQIKVANEKFDKRLSIIESKVANIEKSAALHEKEVESKLKERSRDLREEIIKSNQVALDLLMEEVKSNPPEPTINSGDVRSDRDALKYRYREAQEMIQQQAY